MLAEVCEGLPLSPSLQPNAFAPDDSSFGACARRAGIRVPSWGLSLSFSPPDPLDGLASFITREICFSWLTTSAGDALVLFFWLMETCAACAL